MKKMGVLFFAGCVLCGCASSGGGSVHADNAATAAASASAAEQAMSETDAAVAKALEQNAIDASCRSKVVEAVVKVDGKFEVLLEDRSLYQIESGQPPKLLRILSDDAHNYTLLSEADVVIHWHPDRIMLEQVETGTELFKMDGDPANRKIWFSNDSAEISLKKKDGRYNVWSTKKGFGGISPAETVQDFINRQSPDHQLGYPGNVTAMSLGVNGNVVVAINYPQDYAKDPNAAGKSGLIYHLDTVNAPGKLSVMSRTNSTVKSLAISNNSKYIGAIDTTGQFFFIDMSRKSFVVFGRDYKNVNKIRFAGDDPILVTADSVIILDHLSGAKRFTLNLTYDDCRMDKAASGNELYCYGDGYLDFYDISTNKLLRRLALTANNYTMVEEGQRSGTCP